MRRATKHNVRKISFAPLSGGINVAVPEEHLAENEASEITNFLFEPDSMRLVGRGGCKQLVTFGAAIRGTYYDIESNTTFVFLSDRSCYQLIISNGAVQQKYIGKVSGDKIPKCEKFKNLLYVASGDHLQYYDFSRTGQLTTMFTAPKCDMLFYRWGRLAVTMSGSDRITYSSTGDASSDVAWVENTNDDSSSKWLDIGDSDAGGIVEIVPLATDMIIFKSNGKAYQLAGDADFNSWAVYNVSNFTDLTGAFKAGFCATNIGNEVVFLSLRGLKTLSATQDYGNVATTDIGAKFNKLLTKSMYEPEMYNMRRHRTILIRPTSDPTYWVAYNYGLNAATTLQLGIPVTCVLETKDDVFIASGNTLYLWDNTSTLDGDTEIDYVLVPRAVIGSDELLVKAIDTKFSSDHAGTAKLMIGDRLKVDMPTNSRRKVRCNHSTDYIEIEIHSNSRFEVDHIVLDIADL